MKEHLKLTTPPGFHMSLLLKMARGRLTLEQDLYSTLKEVTLRFLILHQTLFFIWYTKWINWWDLAKTLLDLCEDNQVTKEALHYLIKIVEINVSQKELFELLLLPRNEKEILSLYSLLTRKSPNKIGHGLQKASFESTSGEDNVSSNFKDTIMWDIFTKMNTSNDHETRKLAAYIIWLLTYNNFTIQQEVCKRFNFSPIDGIMIFNQIPSQLIVEIYFENGYLTNG